MERHSEYLLLVAYHQSRIESCSRPGGHEFELDGSDIIVRVTRMLPPPAPWAIPCSEDLLEVETMVHIGTSFTPGQTYHVKVDGRETTTFILPEPDFPDLFIDLSLVERVEVVTLESAPPQYELRVISGLPKGSGCSRSKGYEIRRTDPTRIDVDVTHHEVADPYIYCAPWAIPYWKRTFSWAPTSSRGWSTQ